MRLSRTDLLPVLTIVAGGLVGASVSFRLMSSDDVPAPDPVVVPTASRAVVALSIPPDVWVPLILPNMKGEPWVYVRIPYGKDGAARIDRSVLDLSFRPDVENQERSLFYIDGVRFGSADLSLELHTIENIQGVRGAAAIALYGEEASAGVVLISLKEDLPQG